MGPIANQSNASMPGLFWWMRFLYVGRISVRRPNDFLDISLGLEVSQGQPFNLAGPQSHPT